MAFSIPAPRKLLHSRSIRLTGYQREDRLWDIEAQLTDTKTYSMHAGSGDIPAGSPLHDMHIRLTLDDTLEVKAIETTLEHFPLATCPEVTSNYQSLIGIKIGPGWRDAIRERVGGVNGCTHLTEMLSSLATVAMQTIGHARRVQYPPSADKKSRPHRIGRCYSWATDSPAVKKYDPEYYTGNSD